MKQTPIITKELPHDKQTCKAIISTQILAIMETESKLKRAILCKLLIEEISHLY